MKCNLCAYSTDPSSHQHNLIFFHLCTYYKDSSLEWPEVERIFSRTFEKEYVFCVIHTWDCSCNLWIGSLMLRYPQEVKYFMWSSVLKTFQWKVMWDVCWSILRVCVKWIRRMRNGYEWPALFHIINCWDPGKK